MNMNERHRLMQEELDADPDTFEVKPMDLEGVFFSVNNVGMEMTADQAEAFGIALILAAYKSREMEKKYRLNFLS